MMRPSLALAALALLPAFAGCAAHSASGRHAPAETRATATPSDSATVLLWHFDEGGGARVPDAGPLHKDGVAGRETRADFGRIGGGRTFSSHVESFVWSPWQAELECPEAVTVECWLRLGSYSGFEDSPIAARWTPRGNEQSWLFAVIGRNLSPDVLAASSPGYHRGLVSAAAAAGLGKLLFAFQPRGADSPRAYASSQTIELGRWTHVAVTYDGRTVRFFVNGVMDAQYAYLGAIRESAAPLLVGNAFDPHWLSNYGDDLHLDPTADPTPYYALDGTLDELRLSNVARTDFPYAR